MLSICSNCCSKYKKLTLLLINIIGKKFFPKKGFPSHQKDWKKFELNNESIALNILYVPHNTEDIKRAYLSKHNTNRENQVVLLIITDGKKCHYLAIKNYLHYLEW